MKRTKISYGALRKLCLEEIRNWPGCETVSGIQLVRGHGEGQFCINVTLYGVATKKLADRAAKCIEREKQRFFSLAE